MIELDRDIKPEEAAASQRAGAASDVSELNESSDFAFIPTPEDLPMVVWLVGTEPWFSEFSLEADHVMASLGIKRTRLTQIAGRELRVGRVRRGRYISPVFRPEDVEQYLKWSRAPSTHIKSSTMISEAADTLRQQANLLESQFLELKETMTADFESGIRRAIMQSEATSMAQKAQIQRSFLLFSEQVAERIQLLDKRQGEFSHQFSQMTHVIEKLQAGQMAILQTLQESKVRSSTEMAQIANDLGCALSQVEEKILAASKVQKENLRPNRSVLRTQKMLHPRSQYKKHNQLFLDDNNKSKPIPAVRRRMLRSKA